jgi:hypothetical protein
MCPCSNGSQLRQLCSGKRPAGATLRVRNDIRREPWCQRRRRPPFTSSLKGMPLAKDSIVIICFRGKSQIDRHIGISSHSHSDITVGTPNFRVFRLHSSRVRRRSEHCQSVTTRGHQGCFCPARPPGRACVKL